MTNPHRYIRVVSLWVHPGQEAAFEAFEREAGRIMSRHGGRIDHAVRIEPPDSNRAGDAPFEVHVVSFPARAAYEAYSADPAVLALKERRERIISCTVSMEGWAAGPY